MRGSHSHNPRQQPFAPAAFDASQVCGRAPNASYARRCPKGSRGQCSGDPAEDQRQRRHSASNNFEAGQSGVNAPAAPSTMKHHHVDPEDPVHLQKIVDASYLADDTLFNEMEAGRKLAAETLAETPPPRKRKARTAEGAIEISPDSNCMSCSTNPISPGTPL